MWYQRSTLLHQSHSSPASGILSACVTGSWCKVFMSWFWNMLVLWLGQALNVVLPKFVPHSIKNIRDFVAADKSIAVGYYLFIKLCCFVLFTVSKHNKNLNKEGKWILGLLNLSNCRNANNKSQPSKLYLAEAHVQILDFYCFGDTMQFLYAVLTSMAPQSWRFC